MSLFNFAVPYIVNNNYSDICNISLSKKYTPKSLV